MAGQRFATDEARVGIVKGEMLKYAMTRECLSRAGTTDKMPTNSGKVYKWKRWLIPDMTGAGGGRDNIWIASGEVEAALDHARVAEGQTPGAESISSIIMSVEPERFAVLYTYTDDTAIFSEDGIPMQEVKFAGERMTLLRELYNFGKLRAATNAYFGGTGTSTSTVNGPISKARLEHIKSDLRAKYCEPQVAALSGSPNYETYPVQASYVLYGHTDLESDCRALPDFIGVHEYGSTKPISEYEIGSAYGFRIVLVPHLVSYPNAGASVGTTGLKGGTKIHVYPAIVMGEDAFRQLALRGHESIDAHHIPHTVRSKSDPGGQRGYVWGSFRHAARITNQDWMAVLEVGATNLAAIV